MELSPQTQNCLFDGVRSGSRVTAYIGYQPVFLDELAMVLDKDLQYFELHPVERNGVIFVQKFLVFDTKAITVEGVRVVNRLAHNSIPTITWAWS